jgi:DNA repair exonuclease SbcCD ATPase subunit
MILHRLAVHGPHAFPHDDVVLDFEALPTVLAVHGPNGTGKTTLFDAIAAAVYLVMPYRPGALHRNFVALGAIDLAWELEDQVYRSVVRVDPEAERTEASLFTLDEANAERLLAGPLVKDYRRAVERILGPLETFLASAYAVQSGAGAFLRLPRAERKALLTDLLGLQAFPRYHEAAKTKAAATDKEVDVLRARAEALTARVIEKPGLEAKRQELTGRLERAQDALGVAQTALRTGQELLQAAKAARAALDPVKAELATLQAELTSLAGRLEGIGPRRTAAERTLERATEIRDAVARDHVLANEMAAVDEQIERARRAHQVAVRAAQEAQALRGRIETTLRVAQQRHGNLERQAGLLTTVPCRGAGDYAGCAFLKDARAAVDMLPVVTKEVTDAETALTGTPAPALGDDGTAPVLASKRRRTEERERLAPVVALAPGLEAARARLDELAAAAQQLEQDLASKGGRRRELAAQLEGLAGVDAAILVAQQAVNAADQHVRQAQQDTQWMSRETGQIEAQLTAVLAAEVEYADILQRLAPQLDDLADWTLLTKAFSASGIPALLIDQALPEIGALATELLRECFGEEVFTIALTTQRESADGAKLLETLDVVVRRGAETIDAVLLSGGEAVLVSEALSLALALYTATRSGRRIQTLLRDEVSAPLDVDRAPAYVRMLRRAATLGSFRHVLFVSHQPTCLELADARLEVRDGRVRVA